MNVLPSSYTICVYLRLSREDSDIWGRKVESGSITSQRRLILDFIKKQPEFAKCKVIERCDDGLSGKHFDTRPQFKDMIELAKKGKTNCIIVKDCSRFGRDYVELGDYLEQLFPFLGVRFISINDNYDSDKSEGGLDIAFKNLVYDIYSRDLSKKVKATKKRMASQGKYMATQTLYGYRKKKNNRHQLEIDPEAAAIVREIFDGKLAGISMAQIARNLNARGVKCATPYQHEMGRPTNRTQGFDKMYWTSDAVLKVLSNEIYTGTMVSLKTEVDVLTGKTKAKPEDKWVRVDGTHEAIVTKEEFQKVQEMIRPQSRTTQKQKIRYRCGNCGKTLSRRKNKTLFCAMSRVLSEDCECRKTKVKEPVLDEIVLGELKAKLKRILDVEELKLEHKNEDITYHLENIKKTLESVKKAKQMLFEKLADRSIDRETFKATKKQYDEEIAELEQRLSDASMQEMLLQDTDDETGEKVKLAKSFLDMETMTEEMWDTFVQDVFVYPEGRMEIHWNFEDEME